MNKEFVRRNKLFYLLSQQSDYKPASFFADLLQTSEKTLYGDVKALNDEISELALQIEKVPRKGLKLLGSAQAIKDYSNRYRDNKSLDLAPLDRQRRIAQLLVLSNEKVNISDLEDKMFISKTPIKNDIQVLKKYFAKKHVEVVVTTNNVSLVGKERDIQNAYINFESDYFKQGGLLPFSEITKELSYLFDASILKVASEFVEFFASRKIKGLSEAYSSALHFALCVLFTRVKNEKHVKDDTPRFVFQDLEQMAPYMLAMNCSMQLSDKLGIIMDENDIRYLSEILFSYGIEPTVDLQMIGDSYKNVVIDAIDKMSQLLKTDLRDDHKLYESLLAHVVPMIYRLKNGVIVRNPLLPSIKRQYMVMFTLTWYVSAIFEEKFNVKINDDEVSFLTIYFQVSFAKKSKPKNILIVCPNGLATSELVYSQIKDILPANDHVEITTINQVLENDIKDVEFIISLVPEGQFQGIDKKVFYVSPLITEEELSEISKYYGSINQQISRLRNVGKTDLVGLTNYFDDNFLYWQRDFSNKQQALDFMISKYEEYGYVKNDFRDSVYVRETQGITTISPTVAMPHASPKTVIKTIVSIMTLQKSIKWDDCEVDTIIMIAVSENDIDEIREIISKLYDLVEDGQNGNLLKKVKSNEEFAYLLQENSKKEGN